MLLFKDGEERVPQQTVAASFVYAKIGYGADGRGKSVACFEIWPRKTASNLCWPGEADVFVLLPTPQLERIKHHRTRRAFLFLP
jgi:hypothetical protein